MFYLYYILGIITGIFLLKIYQLIKINKQKQKTKKPKYLRRGIYTNSYTISNSGVHTGSVDVQFEIGELEKTSNKSKVEVINISTSNAEYNREGPSRDRLVSMINISWIDSNLIEWIEDPIQKIRDEKLNEILN